MTIDRPSPWAPAATVETEPLDLSAATLATIRIEIDSAIRAGQVRFDWKSQARRAVADGIRTGVILKSKP